MSLHMVIGVDSGESVGLAFIPIDERWNVLPGTYTAVVRAPTSTKLSPERRVELERTFCLKIEAAVRHGISSADFVVAAIENPIDARAYWRSKTARGGRFQRRESPETRYGQGVNFATAVHAIPANVSVVAYPVKGRKGLAGWQGGRTAKDIVFQMRTFLQAQHRVDIEDVSEHELMACGVALHHIDRCRFRQFPTAQGQTS